MFCSSLTVRSPFSSFQPRILLDYTGFDAEEIRECSQLIVEKVREEGTGTSSRRNLVAVKRKYESRKYHHISSEFEDPVMDYLLDA